MTKQVSQLDTNGYFVGVTTADESPLEEGVFLIPAGTVDSIPPSIPEGKLARWNGEWTLEDIPQPEPEEPPVEPEPFKPKSVTMRQARLALLEAGYYSSVQTAINAIEDPIIRQASQIEWEYAATVDRNSSFTQGMANALGLTEQDMDNLFMLAWSK
ncbi:hypothetical protein P26059A_0029 [Curvibacter phage P26059A]|nr:hypothetical protein P26059A_0029 [Curvibacter phage P26059A]